MKKFFTIAPLQHVEAGTLIYQAMNNEKLQYNVPTCFPVLPLIHGYITAGDSAEFFILTAEDHQTALENYKIIECEIKKLCTELRASCTVNKINIPFDETVETHLNTFKAVVEKISNGDIILADITYGSKCLAILLMMALNYGYRACKNCIVDCFIYGSLDFREGHPCGRRIYDITPLFLMDQIVNELAKSGNRAPAKTIESILNMNERMKAEE